MDDVHAGEVETSLVMALAPESVGTPPGKDGNFAHAFSSAGCNVALADGSVRTLSRGTKDTTFQWACDPKNLGNAPADW